MTSMLFIGEGIGPKTAEPGHVVGLCMHTCGRGWFSLQPACELRVASAVTHQRKTWCKGPARVLALGGDRVSTSTLSCWTRHLSPSLHQPAVV